MVIDIDYDELNDDYFYVCDTPNCPKPYGKGHMAYRDAQRDADHHDQQHDDGVI